MVFVRNPTGVSHSPDEHAEIADCLAGVEALADVLAELTAGAGVTAYLLERAWLGDRFADDVLVEVEDGRFTSVHARRRPAARRARCRGLRRAGPRQHPQPRLPPRAARAHPARARHVLDLARADVRRRRAARPRHLPRPRAGDLPRDGGRRDHLRRGVPLPPPPAATARPTPTPTRWGWPSSRRRGEAGHPAHAARHALPLLRLRCRARGGAGALQRRLRRGVGGAASTALRRRRRTPASGAAVHSVRAVPRDRPGRGGRRVGGRPFHVHLSEQVAENDACLAALRRHSRAAARRPRSARPDAPRSSTPPT